MDKTTTTQPPINILTNNEDIIWWQKKYLNLHRSLPRPLVRFHKEQLGKQHYCHKGSEYRFWVWERDFVDHGKRMGWRVYVNNKKGVCFEITSGCDVDNLKLLIEDYLSALDIELI